MEVKTSKNDYGYMRVHCPFCPHLTRESNKDKLRWLKQHIFKMAKIEALEFMVQPDPPKDNPHLEYVKEHTKNERVIKTENRVFDEDLKIKK